MFRNNIILIYLIISQSLLAGSLSLQEILDYASANSKTLQIKQTDAQIESKNIDIAKSAYYPSLNVVYNMEYNKALDGSSISNEYIGGMNIPSETRYQSSVALQLNHDLYHFGVTDKQVDIAFAEYNVKRIEWCSAEKELHKNILERYASAFKATTERKYKEKMLGLRKRLYSIKTRLYNVGQYSKVDLGDEAISIISLENDIKNVSIRYKGDIIKLSELSYMDIGKDVELLPLSMKNDEIKIQKYEDTTEGMIFQERIAQKESEISMQLREQLPSVGLYSSYYYYGSDQERYKDSLSNLGKKSWNAGLAVRFNIFEGFKHTSKHTRLKLELERIKQQYDEAQHIYKYDIRSKSTRINELNILQKNGEYLIEQNNKKIDMLRRLRKNQKIDIITELNAEYELLERTLNEEIRNIDTAYESVSLDILNRGINQCSQH